MTILSLITALTLLAAGSSHSSGAADTDWRSLHSNARVVCELGPVTMLPAGTRQAAIRRTFKVPGERASAIDTVEFGCTAGTYRYLDVIIYDRDGDVVNRYHLSDQSRPVPEGSYLAKALHMACGSGR